MRAIFSLRIFVALAISLAAPPAFATATSNISVASDQWYDLGVGPLMVEATTIDVSLTTADTQPSAGAVQSGNAGLYPVLINSPTHVWAKAPAGQTATVTVTPQVGGASATGSTGLDYSANTPAFPNIGANFGGAGPYANYVLVATLPASSIRHHWRLENPSGVQLVIVRDDGTASGGAAPTNASMWPIAGTTTGAQGGSDGDAYFKGRIQIYAPAALTGNQYVTLMQE